MSALSLDLWCVIFAWYGPCPDDLSKKLSVVCREFNQTLLSDTPWKLIFGSCWERTVLTHWSGMQAWSLQQKQMNPTDQNIRFFLNPCYSHQSHLSALNRVYERDGVKIHLIKIDILSHDFCVDAGLLIISLDDCSFELPVLYLWHLLFRGTQYTLSSNVAAHVSLKLASPRFTSDSMEVTLRILLEWKGMTLPFLQSFRVKLIQERRQDSLASRTLLVLWNRQRKVELPLKNYAPSLLHSATPVWCEGSEQLIWDRSSRSSFSLFGALDKDSPFHVMKASSALDAKRKPGGFRRYTFVIQLTRCPYRKLEKSNLELEVDQVCQEDTALDDLYLSLFQGRKFLTCHVLRIERHHDHEPLISHICPTWLSSHSLIIWIFNHQLQLRGTAMLVLPRD